MAAKSPYCSELSSLGPTRNGLGVDSEELRNLGRGQQDFLVIGPLQTHTVDVPFAPFERKVLRSLSAKTRLLVITSPVREQQLSASGLRAPHIPVLQGLRRH